MARKKIEKVQVSANQIIAFNIYCNWKRPGFGFGQAQVCLRPDGTFGMDDELMGSEMVREIMHAAVDAALDRIEAAGPVAYPGEPDDPAPDPKPDLIEALATIELAQLLEGTHRINVDPFDPSKATATMPDGTTVAGTLDARGNFTPSPTTQGEPNVQSDG